MSAAAAGPSTATEEPVIITERVYNNNGSEVRRYSKGRLLGKGGFARVYELTDVDSGEIFAGKIVLKSSLTKSRAKQKLMTEIRIHRTLHHEHIVQFKRYFEDDEAVYILLELCDNQTMMEYLKARKRIKEPQVRGLMRQVIKGCLHLRERNVIHRDLKLGNLFLTKESQVKIGDFGLATQLEDENQRKKTICGTPNYIAPEVLNAKKGHSFEADVWSLGVVLYTMLVGRPPFETSDVKSTYKRIQNNDYCFPDHAVISDEARQLITSILQTDPAARPTLEELVAHPFFQSRGALRPLSAYGANQLPEPRSQSAKRRLSNPSEGESTRGDTKRSSRDVQRGGKTLSAAMPVDPPAEQVEPLQKSLAQMHISCDEPEEPLAEGYAGVPGAAGLQGGAAALQLLGTAWVSRWVDYSHKYGVGYMLSDGSVGVYFNDASKIILAPDGERVEYTPRRKDKMEREPECFRLDAFPEEHVKKVTLLKHFQNYLVTHDTVEGFLPLAASPTGWKTRPQGKSIPFVKKWLKTRHAIVFRLSTRLVQVNFFDNSSIVLSIDTNDVGYVNKQHRCSVQSVRAGEEAPSADMEKRLKYAREILCHFASGGQSTKPQPGMKENNIPTTEPAAAMMRA